jgi:hypothetical protein
MSRYSARKLFTALKTNEDIEHLIRRKKLYALISSGPIKRYSRVTHHEQVDMDCIEFTLADGSILESFVSGNHFEGVFIKTNKINASHGSLAAGGGTQKRRSKRRNY